jgi:2,4-dienoyl-CoA reductase-like NADH-dependent reductase (Old Yellow Enzyme family)
MAGDPKTRWEEGLLFSPLQVGTVRLHNRIVLPPIKTNMDLSGEQARAWYRERARGGAGLVIVEATPLEQFEQDSFLDGLRGLAAAIHEAGAAAAIQLYHPGRIDGEQVAASDVNGARAATSAEVAAIPERYARPAAMAEEAGFEGAEVHGAHDFFLNRFFSPKHNRREDEYGGSLEGRMRLGLECTRAVRDRCEQKFLVLYRHTAAADYPLADSLVFAPELEKVGLDIIDISPSTSGPDADHVDLAAAIREKVSCPVIAVGGMEDPEAAEKALRKEKADLVAIGRALIADAHLPRKWLEGRREEIIECIKCDEMCFGNLEKGIPIGCSQNREAGLEYRLD